MFDGAPGVIKHGEDMGKPWENHGEIMGKSWEKHGKT
jgi:hypothetical protein